MSSQNTFDLAKELRLMIRHQIDDLKAFTQEEWDQFCATDSAEIITTDPDAADGIDGDGDTYISDADAVAFSAAFGAAHGTTPREAQDNLTEALADQMMEMSATMLPSLDPPSQGLQYEEHPVYDHQLEHIQQHLPQLQSDQAASYNPFWHQTATAGYGLPPAMSTTPRARRHRPDRHRPDRHTLPPNVPRGPRADGNRCSSNAPRWSGVNKNQRRQTKGPRANRSRAGAQQSAPIGQIRDYRVERGGG